VWWGVGEGGVVLILWKYGIDTSAKV